MTRVALARLDAAGCQNVGLALDYYAPDLGQLAEAPVPGMYRAAFARWSSHLERTPGVVIHPFVVDGRLSIGAGAESVREWTVTLQSACGVPLIPGSALKGLARRYAAGLANDQEQLVLFGDAEGAAYVTYFDAWYVPGSAPGDAPLALDVVNAHHPAYYQGFITGWPTDFDDPRPISFLSAVGAYLVAVRGPRIEWAESAFHLLEVALAEWGVGARTSSGYGRLHPLPAAGA